MWKVVPHMLISVLLYLLIRPFHAFAFIYIGDNGL
uniref:Uncharacterized protein n=1 Tax=Arundo donax TaxID=35708 RepID=A0A0A8ZE19_ARUDO